MRGPLLPFALALALFCSQSWAAKGKGRASKKRDVVLTVQPGSPRPGSVVSITVLGARSPPEGTLGTRPLLFHKVKRGHRALVPLGVEQAEGPLELKVRYPPEKGKKREIREVFGTLDIPPANFPRRVLKVASKYVNPPPKVKRQIAEDRKAFARAFDQKDAPPLFSGPFASPRPKGAIVTAPFGDLRTYNGKRQSQHYGTDLDGRVGEPIFSTHDGVVVLTRDAYASGRTVIVHHGARLYSAYFHMSKIEVKEGQKVRRGQKLGRVGMTGRVTGPHLHFAIKLEGLYVDPESLLRLAL